MSTNSIQLKLITSDRQLLAATHFRHPSPRGAVLLCSATGIHRRLYTPFANWLVQQGYAVLTFDYRGIGDSLRGAHVRTIDALGQHWGELDMPAALDWLADAYPGTPLNLIGHSAGGQLVGLMHNHQRLAGVVMVGASSGYVQGIAWPTRWLGLVLMCLYVPITARLLGYVPARKVGYGQNLPAGVAMQWARWCLAPGYVLNGFDGEIVRHYHEEFSAPIYSVSATDDPIATPENIEDLLRLFPNARIQRARLQPSQFGLKSIGHIDMLRPTCAFVWPEILRGLH